MNYTVDRANRPVYLQIYQQIRNDIISGVFAYNRKLPSKRLLAEELGISTITVEHAYALLCDEGYAEARQRSGYYVIFRQSDGFAAVAPTPLKQPSAHQTMRTSPDFSVSVLSKTIRKVLSECGNRLLEKSPNSGCLELREALRNYLARNRGIHVETRQIIIGSGAEYLYRLIVELLGQNRTVAIEDPSYKKIRQVYQAAGVCFTLLPLTQDGIDSSALSASNADILHTTPYRSFPTGVTASASKRHEYIRWANAAERYIIEDDFESEFSVSAKPTETLFTLAEKENVIYLNTFSKTIAPSLRIGYMVLPQKLIPVFENKLGFYSCTVPTFDQLVLSELIASGSFERHINRVRRHKRRNLEKR